METAARSNGLPNPVCSQHIIINAEGPLERIGYGSCGTVWADPSRDDGVVLKRGDGLPERSISNEEHVHRLILTSLSAEAAGWADFRLNVPNNFGFLQPNAGEWGYIIPRLPQDFIPCEALINERIAPMPRAARHTLVEAFWTGGGGTDAIIDDKKNGHCLIRPYLGRRRAGARRSMLKCISLRNYPLHVDQMEQLRLPTEQYATAMADTLAFLLWRVRVDANDVEFVLARPREQSSRHPHESQPGLGSREFAPGVLGPHTLWFLDFDCCKMLDMSEKGVNVAAERFWRNDPFYPNPDCKCAQDKKLWELFRDRFLLTSRMFLKEEEDVQIRQLPDMLVARIVETVGVYSKGIGHR